MKNYYVLIILLHFSIVSCHTRVDKKQEAGPGINQREIIIKYSGNSPRIAEGFLLQDKFTNRVTADNETEPVESPEGEDAADDPAIWYNTEDPAKSLVLGSNKISGIYVYDLDGNKLQFRNAGRINNIDLRDGFCYKNKTVVLVTGSNRSNNSITLFFIDKEKHELSDSLANIKSGVDEVYGICLYKSLISNEFYVFVNGKGGMIEQWGISVNDGIKAKMLRSLSVTSQPEGMAADDLNAVVYLGVEQEGIFKINAEPDENAVIQKLPGSDAGNPNIACDIEGLAIFVYKNNPFLVASSQGNFSYALFNLGASGRYLTSFIIADGIIDGAEETDGIEVVAAPLNNRFKQGMLVVQDGFNTCGNIVLNQNFKFISLEKILDIIDNEM